MQIVKIPKIIFEKYTSNPTENKTSDRRNWNLKKCNFQSQAFWYDRNAPQALLSEFGRFFQKKHKSILSEFCAKIDIWAPEHSL